MKLYWGSIALQLAFEIAWYGNVPFSALKLYPYPYESTKDAIQKLIRAGYVDAIKAKHLKSLYITPLGRKAVDETRMKYGREKMEPTPIIYHPPKATRVDKISETQILFNKAELADRYYNCRNVKQHMETNARGSDQLKYSRFVGFWEKEDSCSIVYHFGRTNVQLNKNGELNAEVEAMSISNNVDKLILGDNIDTLLSVLRYSLWLHQKPKNQRGHLKNIHYHIDLESRDDDKTCFLPISSTSMQILKMMQNSGWKEWIGRLQNCYRRDGLAIWGMLDCRIRELLINRIYPEWTQSGKVLIVCYDWQENLIKDFFSDIADRKEIWIQIVPTQTVFDISIGKSAPLPCEYKHISCKQ